MTAFKRYHARVLITCFTVTLLLASMFVLAGCETSFHADGGPQPKMTFAHLQPIPLNIGMLKTHDTADMISNETFVVSPYQSLRDYLHARFRPGGFNGILNATIENASITHSFESSDQTINKALNVGGLDVYDMTILLKLEHIDSQDKLKYGTVLTVRRIIKVSEHASIAERERRQYRAMEALFADLDREILRVVLAEMKLGL